MLTIGVNGGSGCGKSLFSTYAASMGFYHIDCDIIARQVVEKGTKCLSELVNYFSNSILNNDGTLNRKELAKTAFETKEKTDILNNITHKYILSEIRNIICDLPTHYKGVIVDGATLIESGFYKECDYNVFVCAPTDVRLEHIMKRDNLSRREALQRLSAQKADNFYKRHCDYTLINDSDIESFKEKAEKIITKILKKEMK